MRYVCKVYADDSIYAYETDENLNVINVIEGQKEEGKVKRISAYVEAICDSDEQEVGISRLKKAIDIIEQNLKLLSKVG